MLPVKVLPPASAAVPRSTARPPESATPSPLLLDTVLLRTFSVPPLLAIEMPVPLPVKDDPAMSKLVPATPCQLMPFVLLLKLAPFSVTIAAEPGPISLAMALPMCAIVDCVTWIIASDADTSPGPDGNYSEESPVDSLRPWVEAAGRAGMYVVLDLQPGRTDFLTQAQTYRDLLTLPYVGLGLDPEWRIGPSQVPGDQIGAVDAAEVNTVITWLADLTTTADLPQKLLVIHQFDPATLRDENTLDVSHPQVAVLLQMDGQGTPDLKDRAWQAVTTAAPPGVRYGWMNLGQDTPMLTPAQTMSKQPTPWMITHQ